MELSVADKKTIIENLLIEFDGKMDGGRKNILVPECPFCGHGGFKYGIYVGKESSKYKVWGSSHCFSCGKSFRTLKETLNALGHSEWLPKETTDLNKEVLVTLEEDEIDDSLEIITMPDGYKRTFKNSYLKSRGFFADDYQYFPAGTTRGMNRKFDDYILIEIRDAGRLVGYVARHTWSKDDIDSYNDSHRFQIRRYNNSTENQFSKLLYNYDSVIEDETDTVILCEGVFDVIGLTQKLELYDNHRIVPVATFGKKISECQMMKLQHKGVENIVIGYDNDSAAKDAIGHVANQLEDYFDVFCLQYPKDSGKDFGDMSFDEIYDIFANHIVRPREFVLNLGL